MRFILTALVIGFLLSMAVPAIADEGRYQAVAIQTNGDEKVLILDTKEGYCWTWLPPSDSRVSSIIKYEGKIRVGKKPGEFITGPPMVRKDQR
jgi:hypothetical protein